MLPKHLQELLDTPDCADIGELVDWRRKTLEKAIDLAEPIQRSAVEVKIDSTPRAYCPLCEADSAGLPWIKGYAIPKGAGDALGRYRQRA